jgi:hypothetical protein
VGHRNLLNNIETLYSKPFYLLNLKLNKSLIHAWWRPLNSELSTYKKKLPFHPSAILQLTNKPSLRNKLLRDGMCNSKDLGQDMHSLLVVNKTSNPNPQPPLNSVTKASLDMVIKNNPYSTVFCTKHWHNGFEAQYMPVRENINMLTAKDVWKHNNLSQVDLIISFILNSHIIRSRIELLQEIEAPLDKDLIDIVNFFVGEELENLLQNSSDKDLLYLPLTMSKLILPNNYEIITRQINYYEITDIQ